MEITTTTDLGRISTTVPVPDTKSLPVINFEAMLSLHIVDEETNKQALIDYDLAEDFINQVNARFDEPTKAAHDVHKWFTTTRNTLTSPAAAVIAHLRSEIKAYRQKKEDRRLALQNRLNEEQEALSMVGLADPNSQPVVIPQHTDGELGDRWGQWSYEVDDLMKTLRAALGVPEDCICNPDYLIVGLLTVDDARMKAAAKTYKGDLAQRVPGVRAIRSKTFYRKKS